MMWATDTLNGALTDFSWETLQPELAEARTHWTRHVIDHAKSENVFFPPPQEDLE